jgi:hypothetical protein
MLRTALLAAAALTALTATARADEFVPLFDGKTLDGWHVLPASRTADWSVRDGAIVGASQGQGSYLMWKDEALADFELKLSYRFRTPGNSGIQVRAQPATARGHRMTGYHADIGDVTSGPGVLGAWDYWANQGAPRGDYLVARGQRVRIDENGRKHFSAVGGAVTPPDIKDRDWNEVHLVARGNRLFFTINGKMASEVIDEEKARFLEKGGIGLQLHTGKPMTIDFKDLRLKRIVPGPGANP